MKIIKSLLIMSVLMLLTGLNAEDTTFRFENGTGYKITDLKADIKNNNLVPACDDLDKESIEPWGHISRGGYDFHCNLKSISATIHYMDENGYPTEVKFSNNDVVQGGSDTYTIQARQGYVDKFELVNEDD